MNSRTRKLSFSEVVSKASWQKMLGLGAVLFTTFFWLFPAGLWLIFGTFKQNIKDPTQTTATQQFANGMTSLIESIYNTFSFGLKGLAVILTLVCIFYAIRNYFSQHDGHR